MKKTNLFFLCASLAYAFLIFPTGAEAWPLPVQEQAAQEVIKLLPVNTAMLFKSRKDSFLKGGRDEPDLFKDVSENSKKFSISALREIGIQRFYIKYSRLQSMLNKKSDDKALVYQFGGLTRLAIDLFEPLPSDSDYNSLQIVSLRPFFLNDMEEKRVRFTVVPAGLKVITSFPETITSNLEASEIKGKVIYNAYWKGDGFKSIEPEAHEMLNRSINFVVDTIYTLYMNRTAGRGVPFNPEAKLGLDRFRNKTKKKDFEIKSPEAPKPPATPDVLKSSPDEGKKGNEK